VIERDEPERLSADDMATSTEAEFLASALARQAQQGGQQHTPGTCANCGARCLPLAKYCDRECREDHEWRINAGRG
tara:strand:- start:13018 stop:13245 length:228 start_codon:yes stop_codon:yes gene_type:complete